MVFPKRNSERPLPLKQRTSSQDQRRDYSHNTWWSLLVLLKPREYFVTVDNFSIWRRHLAWAMENGTDLRAYMTQRYGSSMVFMSLLLSAELGVLFNSSGVTTDVRFHLKEGNHFTPSFWAGFMIIVSVLLTLLSLISTFTAWAMVNAVDEANAHCILRSSIGQYAAELPGRLIVCSIYSFLISFMLFFFLLLPVGPWSIVLLSVTLFLFVHIVSSFSAFGRVIMHSGAMGKSRIFTPEYEEFLLPHSLHTNLLVKAQANLDNNTSIFRQYRRQQKPIDRHLTKEEMYNHLCGRLDSVPDTTPYRPRADSTVRFADEEDLMGGGSFAHTTQHARTMTPLSETSSNQFSEASSMMDRPQSMGHSSFLKSALNRPQRASRPPLPTPLTTTDAMPMRNVSTSSLEQWLQASPLSTDGARKPTTSPTGEISTGGNETNNHLSTSPPPQPEQGRTPTSIVRNPVSRPPRLSDVTLDDRDLSEDERFSMDYGDIEDADSEQHFAAEYNVVDHFGAGGEKASLLGDSGSRSSSYYSSASGDGIIQPTTGSKKPPSIHK
jgi:hypothetical protein